MAKVRGNERLVKNHRKYFENESAMERANPYRLLVRGKETHRPPIMIIQGNADDNVNHEWQDAFAERYIAAGGDCLVHKFEGQPHTFVTKILMHRSLKRHSRFYRTSFLRKSINVESCRRASPLARKIKSVTIGRRG